MTTFTEMCLLAATNPMHKRLSNHTDGQSVQQTKLTLNMCSDMHDHDKTQCLHFTSSIQHAHVVLSRKTTQQFWTLMPLKILLKFLSVLVLVQQEQ